MVQKSVDHQLIWSMFHYLQAFIHVMWLAGFLNHQQCVVRLIHRQSSINGGGNLLVTFFKGQTYLGSFNDFKVQPST